MILVSSKVVASSAAVAVGVGATVIDVAGLVAGVVVAVAAAVSLIMAIRGSNRTARVQHEAELKAEHDAGAKEERERLTPQLNNRTEQYNEAARQRDRLQEKYDQLIQKQLDRIRGPRDDDD